MRRSVVALTFVLAALLLSACGGGGSSTGGGSGGSSTSASGGDARAGAGGGAAKTPEQVWAKEVEGVMRQFENASAHSVEAIHTSASQYLLEPTYAQYSDELAKLGKQLEATKPPAACVQVQDRMGVLSRKVSDLMGVLDHQSDLSPEEFTALSYQQTQKFARVGRQLTNLTIEPHC
jgi:hypothetical protein